MKGIRIIWRQQKKRRPCSRRKMHRYVTWHIRCPFTAKQYPRIRAIDIWKYGSVTNSVLYSSSISGLVAVYTNNLHGLCWRESGKCPIFWWGPHPLPLFPQLAQEAEGWGERMSELEEEMRMCESSYTGMVQDAATKDESIKVCIHITALAKTTCS